MPFSRNAEDTFAHRIDIRNKYQLCLLWSVKKLLEKLFSVNDLPISNYGNAALKTRLAPEFALNNRIQKTSLYGNMQHIKCIKIMRPIDYFPVMITNSCGHFRPIK